MRPDRKRYHPPRCLSNTLIRLQFSIRTHRKYLPLLRNYLRLLRQLLQYPINRQCLNLPRKKTLPCRKKSTTSKVRKYPNLAS